MTRSKQERMPVILSVCLTQKGCSVEIAGTAYSPRLVALRTTIILRRDAVFTSSFGCGRAAVCVRQHVDRHAGVVLPHLAGEVVVVVVAELGHPAVGVGDAGQPAGVVVGA